jgi:WS/DGAT/MGAT family acyltransferase
LVPIRKCRIAFHRCRLPLAEGVYRFVQRSPKGSRSSFQREVALFALTGDADAVRLASEYPEDPMTAFMRSSDAFTWSMETDPRLRSTVVTVMVLDRSPDWEEIRERIRQLSSQFRLFRQRVVEGPLKAPPRWEECEDFDLNFHMRRVAVPAGASFDYVLELARLAEMEALDPARPLWKITLVEGLPEGRAAVLCVFHHALSDGVGGVQIAAALFNLSDMSGDGALPSVQSAPSVRHTYLDAVRDYLDAVRDAAGLVRGAATTARSSISQEFRNGVRNPLQAFKSTAQMAGSVYRTIRPIGRTGSSLMTARTLRRQLAVLDVPLPQLKAAGHRVGCTINDAFVAGVTTGLRVYHQNHGVNVDALHITMPISLRAPEDPPGGNRITLMRFDIPTDLADPAECIRIVHECSNRARHEMSLPHTQVIAGFLNMMPRWYIGSILRHVDFLASDVPGIPVPVTIGGAQVTHQYAFGPTIGAAVNITLLTYVENCSLGIDIDTGAIPDTDAFTESLKSGFDEILTLATS